ncbi:MAG: polymer-forming cytoskeletal protein [Chloroflexi bacterium]|nr:polymer-forming cytoskeletal protein [Chloroflexota bacterium]
MVIFNKKRAALRTGSWMARLFAAVSFVLVSTAVVATPALAASAAPGVSASKALTTAVPPTPTPAPRPEVEDDRRIIRGDQVISGDDFTLRSDETLRGDLTVFGGNARLEEGSRVEGDVSIFGGDTDIYGTVTGNFTAVGGSTHLRSSSVIEGKENVWGGSVQRDPGAVVRGEVTRFNGPDIDRSFTFEDKGWWPFNGMFDLIGNVFAAIASIILVTLFAVAVVALFPTNVVRIADTVQRQWLVSGGIGVLTFVALPIIVGILAITICLIPASIVIAIAWALAVLFGWTVTARIVGGRLTVGFNLRNWTPIAETAFGAVALGLIGALPVIGWLVSFLAAALGLGALILTRVGTRPYPPAPVEPPAAATPPALPPTAA